jgi:hypothetical protein
LASHGKLSTGAESAQTTVFPWAKPVNSTFTKFAASDLQEILYAENAILSLNAFLSSVYGPYGGVCAFPFSPFIHRVKDGETSMADSLETVRTGDTEAAATVGATLLLLEQSVMM